MDCPVQSNDWYGTTQLLRQALVLNQVWLKSIKG